MNRFLIDGMNLAHRAHNANFELSTADGKPTGMIFGFARTLVSLKKKYRGYKFAIAWDSRPESKIAIRPGYKADRTPLPPTVSSELQDIKILVSACGIDQYVCIGEEADDVMATLVKRWACENGHVVIYSNDKDLLQLVVDGKVVVYSPKIAQKPEKFYDESAVKERYGVPPKLLACFRSIDGDPSDGLQGVPRVRRKIVASLVSSSGGLDGVYASVEASDFSPREKSVMVETKERVYQNFLLMALKGDLQGITETLGSVDKTAIEEVLARNQIKSIDAAATADLFASVLNVKYADPVEATKIESYSLF